MILRLLTALLIFPGLLASQGIGGKLGVGGKAGFGGGAAPPLAFVGALGNASTNGTDTTVTVGYTPVTGNTVLIMVDTSIAATISSVKDNLNNVYPLRCQGANGNGGFTGTTLSNIYGTLSVPSGVTSFTVTLTAGPHLWVAVAEYSNVTNFGQCFANGNAGSVTTASSTITTQWNNNFNVTTFAMNVANQPTANTGNLRLTGCPSGCNVTYSGDSAAVVDNTVASPGSLTDSVTMNTSSYAAATIELSTGTFNVVQTKTTFCNGVTSTSTCNPGFFNQSQSGDYILAAATDSNTNGSQTIVFTDGTNTYTQVTPGGTNAFCNYQSNTHMTGMSFAKVTATNFFNVVATNSGSASGNWTESLIEVNGLNPTQASVLDQTSTCNDVTSTSGYSISPSVTTSQAKEFIYATWGNQSATVYTAGTGYTWLLTPEGSTAHGAAEGQLTSSSGSYTAAVTLTGNTPMELAGFLATFKAQ